MQDDEGTTPLLNAEEREETGLQKKVWFTESFVLNGVCVTFYSFLF